MIKINVENFSPDFHIDLRKVLEKYEVNYITFGVIIIYNPDKDLMEQLELWDIMIERLI